MLTDGGIETRIMFETDIPLPEHVQVAALATRMAGANGSDVDSAWSSR